MPAEGLDWLPTDETLNDDEVVRLMRIGVDCLGIREIRLTGGEPLLRRGLASIISQVTASSPRPKMSITTNALGLKHTADKLAEAGLDRRSEERRVGKEWREGGQAWQIEREEDEYGVRRGAG